jgi:hypothetical protein
MRAHSLLIISSAPPMLDRRNYCNPYCNRADTHWYTLDKAISPEHRKPHKQAGKPDAPVQASMCASKLVAGAGQRFESARWLFTTSDQLVSAVHYGLHEGWMAPRGDVSIATCTISPEGMRQPGSQILACEEEDTQDDTNDRNRTLR